MLAHIDDIRPLFACPRCHRDLVWRTDRIYCANPDCGLADRGFSVLSGQPVLVDFEHSILDERDLARTRAEPAIPRGGGALKRWTKDHLLRPVALHNAAANATSFIELLKRFSSEPRVLVVGGGHLGVASEILYRDPDVRVVGFDLYASELTHFIADAHQVPIRDEAFDGLWIQYVLGHVLDPFRVVDEAYRILKPHGLVYSEAAYMQQVNEGAYDFMRFSHSGHRWLFRRFEEIRSGLSMGPGIQLLWTIENFVRGALRSRRAGQAVKLALFWLQFLDRLLPERYHYDNASATYFLGRKSEQLLRPRDIVGYYRGALFTDAAVNSIPGRRQPTRSPD